MMGEPGIGWQPAGRHRMGGGRVRRSEEKAVVFWPRTGNAEDR